MDCGIFGVYGHREASRLTWLGLYALQHRGDEGAGIVSGDGRTLYQRKGMGLVAEVFPGPESLEPLKGHLAIGHTRYSTTGASVLANVQPFVANCKGEPLAIAHNGNLTNTYTLRRELERTGSLFQTTMDSEVIVHLAARSDMGSPVERLIQALNQVRGAFSLLFATKDEVIAVRDPYGFRPLSLGRLDGAWIAASETCALDLIGADYIRDIEPGEVVVFGEDGMRSFFPFPEPPRRAFCIFEYIYFSRPDSRIFGDYVDKTRRKLGKNLALEHPAEADIVISVPDSSNTAALGYASRSGLRYEIGLIRNHYVGRTFIQPDQTIRDFKVKVKFNPVGGVLKDRRVVVVEDSIVRGTTMRQLVRMLREAGAREVHVRVSCPPIRFPCFYGMDFQTHGELIASKRSVEEIREFIGADSLGYLSKEGMLDAMPGNPEDYCTACFDGEYPVEVEEETGKLRLEGMVL
ncbi:MAG: amidophosphoribosyltransferase [Candidatus Latescibacterota bacterium]|nr:MAG: amidophosphoribosyltransferase [Candidatus Latescibacterota bacterium]